jgi:uncharacterized protein YqhQ
METQRYVNLLFRVVILAAIVYAVVTFVPTTELSFAIKLLITFLVVLTYSILDLMGASLQTTRDGLCGYFC